jgi:hypothetical protein
LKRKEKPPIYLWDDGVKKAGEWGSGAERAIRKNEAYQHDFWASFFSGPRLRAPLM